MLRFVDGLRVIQYNSQENNKKVINYNLWKSIYIRDNNINLNEIVYSKVMRGKFIQITYGKLLNIGDSFPDMGRYIQKISMKAFYTGSDPRKKYIELLDKTLIREHSELYRQL